MGRAASLLEIVISEWCWSPQEFPAGQLLASEERLRVLYLGEIGVWQLVQVFLTTLPEIFLWVSLLGTLGLLLGLALLMISLRWMFPWEALHRLRQRPRGWCWLAWQWTWVCLWGLSLPLLAGASGGLTGAAFGARRLVAKEKLGQVVGERVLGPICQQLACQLQKHRPELGDLSCKRLEVTQISGLLESVTPQLLDESLQRVPLLADAAPNASPLEQAGRRFARHSLEQAVAGYFRQKARFVQGLLSELKSRGQSQADLQQVVSCASHLYFSPAFASWTFWWILGQGIVLIPILLALWLFPWMVFKFYWWRWGNLLAEGTISSTS